MEEQKSLQEKSKFMINELVLCYEPDPMKARVLYDSKILDIEITKDDKGRKVCEYFIHFQGWNKSWDRWILEEQILKDTESSRLLQGKLYKEAIKPKKRKRKTTKTENLEEKDDRSTASNNSAEAEQDDSPMLQLPLVTLDIPKILASHLEDDCYNIKRKKKLICLPRKPSVNDIFADYYSHCEQMCGKPEGRNISLLIVREILEALNTYFNFYVAKLLLYSFEREQYENLFNSSCEATDIKTLRDTFSPPIASLLPKPPTFPQSSEYVDSKASSPSTSRASSVSEDIALGSYVSASNTGSNLKKKRRTRNTISLDESGNSNFVRIRPKRTFSERQENMTQLVSDSPQRIQDHKTHETGVVSPQSPRETRLSRRKFPKEDTQAKEECMVSSPEKLENATASVSAAPRLRRSNRQVKLTKIPKTEDADFLPVGSTAKSLQESNKKGLVESKSFVTTDNILPSGDVNKYENVSGDPSFMPFPTRCDGDTPADIYGVEHLLRLFVKLPLLLSCSNIEDIKIKIIVRYVTTFLNYLSTRTDLFTTSVYSESVI